MIPGMRHTPPLLPLFLATALAVPAAGAPAPQDAPPAAAASTPEQQESPESLYRQTYWMFF